VAWWALLGDADAVATGSGTPAAAVIAASAMHVSAMRTAGHRLAAMPEQGLTEDLIMRSSPCACG
jgi:hypothetical protein